MAIYHTCSGDKVDPLRGGMAKTKTRPLLLSQFAEGIFLPKKTLSNFKAREIPQNGIGIDEECLKQRFRSEGKKSATFALNLAPICI